MLIKYHSQVGKRISLFNLLIVETKNENCKIWYALNYRYVGFLHIYCKSFPGSIRFQSSQHFLQLDWVISCQGQVVSIEHVSYPEQCQ